MDNKKLQRLSTQITKRSKNFCNVHKFYNEHDNVTNLLMYIVYTKLDAVVERYNLTIDFKSDFNKLFNKFLTFHLLNIREYLINLKRKYKVFTDVNTETMLIVEELQDIKDDKILLDEFREYLTDEQKQIFDLLYQNMTYREIGELLGISHTTVYNTIKDLRKIYNANFSSF